MEVESTKNNLFQLLTPQIENQIANITPAVQSQFSLQLQEQPEVCLKLFNNIVTMTCPDSSPVFLCLTFDIKFEIIYDQQKNIFSRKLGIRLFNQQNQQIKLYSSESIVDEWTSKLSKKINQRGFHQMFKPIRKLGKGNFATVYEAERLIDHQRFAVKAFSKQNSYSSSNGKESLINQLSIMRQLSFEPHPNVLKLEAVFESENSIYVVLELMTGQTLHNTIRDRKGLFTKSQIKQVISGLLRGLQHIHSHRIMHRDLKPENIMLRGQTLQPVIVDFGLSTNADLSKYLFFRCGTPGYVAPQIIYLTECAHIEPACDIFSLGAIFHLLLSKKALFSGNKYEQVYRNNKQFKFKIQGEAYKNIGTEALQLLKQMLILSPQTRISPAQALEHGYFQSVQIQAPLQLKAQSPLRTEASNDKQKEKKKKKTFFIF